MHNPYTHTHIHKMSSLMNFIYILLFHLQSYSHFLFFSFFLTSAFPLLRCVVVYKTGQLGTCGEGEDANTSRSVMHSLT